MQEEADGAICLQSPEKPAGKEDQGHGQSHVEVRVDAAEQRFRDHKPMVGLVTPTNGPQAGDKAHPIREENENEHGRKEPKCAFHQVMADDSFEEVIQAFDHPLPEILRAFGHFLHVAGGDLGKHDEPQGDDPAQDHGVADGHAADLVDHHGILWQSMFLVGGRRRACGRFDLRIGMGRRSAPARDWRASQA